MKRKKNWFCAVRAEQKELGIEDTPPIAGQSKAVGSGIGSFALLKRCRQKNIK